MTPSGPGEARDVASVAARRVHEDIEQTLEARTRSFGTRAGRLEALFKDGLDAAWELMKHHPFASFAAVAVVGTAAAATFGATEVVFGSALALAAYKVLREGEPPMKVLEDLERTLLG
jgi:hypothetical protein